MRRSTNRIAVLLAAAVMALVTGSLAAPAATSGGRHAGRLLEKGVAPNHKLSHGTSTNWSGYAVSGGTYKTVTASWVQPSVSCQSTAYSSFWVGIDGDTSNTVEQTGSEADCQGTTPTYSAWYEMYPKYPVTFKNRVSPGDHFTATVATDGSGSFTLTLKDTTKGWTNQTTQQLKKARLASAEVIAEAPSSTQGVLPLANFATVSFSGATVNGSTLTSSTPHIQSITMATSGGVVKARPSSISNGSFTVTWKHQ
jgi:Peptidase A4 family